MKDDLFADYGDVAPEVEARALRIASEVQRLNASLLSLVNEVGTELDSDDEYGAALVTSLVSMTGLYAILFKAPGSSLDEVIARVLKLQEGYIRLAYSQRQKGEPHG